MGAEIRDWKIGKMSEKNTRATPELMKEKSITRLFDHPMSNGMAALLSREDDGYRRKLRTKTSIHAKSDMYQALPDMTFRFLK